jgi:hypothetical protein
MTKPASLPGRPSYLSFLPDFLFSTDSVKARYVARAWALALVPSLLLAILISLIAPGAKQPEFVVDGPLTIAFLVVVGPLIETLLMIPPLLLLNRFAGPGPAVVGSALLWGVLHSLQAPVWGLVAWWLFLIFSIAFLTWRSRGLVTAFLLVTAIHGLQNSVPAALLLLMDQPEIPGNRT